MAINRRQNDDSAITLMTIYHFECVPTFVSVRVGNYNHSLCVCEKTNYSFEALLFQKYRKSEQKHCR